VTVVLASRCGLAAFVGYSSKCKKALGCIVQRRV
jgi:hypothetical protein